MAVVPQNVAQQFRGDHFPPRGPAGDNLASRGLAGDNVASRVLGDHRLSQQSRPYGSTEDNLAARVLGDNRLGGLQQNRSYGILADNTLAARVLGVDNRSGLRQQPRSFGVSDENVLRNQILDTHDSDSRLFAVKPVLHIIGVIFHRTSTDVPGANYQAQNITSRGSLMSSEPILRYRY